jgi:hypothetical protein
VKTNELDTMALTRQIRDELYAQTKGMSSAERLNFYHERARALHQKLGLSDLPLDSPAARRESPTKVVPHNDEEQPEC